MARKKIYIADSYSLNTGDIGILLATIDSLEKDIPGAEIFIESSHPKILASYNLTHKVFPRIFDISNIVGAKVSKSQLLMYGILGFYDSVSFLLYAFLRKLKIPSLWIVRHSRKVQAQTIGEIDVWLSSGGGFLSSFYRFELRLYGYLLALTLNKPYVIFAQSVGPFFGKVHNKLAGYFLNRARLITIREPDSLKYIDKLRLNNPPTLTADIAFLLPSHSDSSLITKQEKTVAFCIKKSNDQYFNSIKKAAEYLVSTGTQVIFVSQTPNDDTTAQNLSKKIPNSIAIPFGLDARKLKGLYSQCDFIIASRMHAIIFASEQNTKWIGIGYEPKFRGLAEQLNAMGILIEENELNFQKLKSAIDHITLSQKTDVSEQVQTLVQKSHENVSLLIKHAL